MKKIKLCAIILVVGLVLSLSACLEKPNDDGEKGNEQITDGFTPTTDDSESSELFKKYKKYENLALTDAGILPIDEALLEYEEVDGGVKITKYIGEESAVAIPDKIDGKDVVCIGKEAFAANRWLTAIVLPDSIKTIESLAFYGCRSLCYIDLGGGKKTVEDYAFANCPSIYGIDLSSCESIGVGSLFGCNSLNFIKLSFVGGTIDENRYLGYIFGAQTPEHNGEMVPESLRKIIIAEGCTDIPDIAFANCKYITSVIIPDSVESIGVRAFYKCRSLIEIDTGDGVRKISDDAFFYCDSLRSVKLGSAVESIGMQAFFGCSSLNDINLTSIKEIGSYAFYGTPIVIEADDTEK